jgi:hypothetical protein
MKPNRQPPREVTPNNTNEHERLSGRAKQKENGSQTIDKTIQKKGNRK